MRLPPDLLDRLAGEYVLGTLRGGARRRFEGWLREQPALHERVLAWQLKLVPMAALLPPQPAPSGTWEDIERRLFGTRRASGWARPLLAAWAAAASLGLAAVVGLLVLQPERLVSLETLARRTEKLPAAYMAVLSAEDGKPALVASAGRYADTLELKLLRPVGPAPPGTRYVLWAHTTSGERFGLGAPDLQARSRLTLRGTAEQALSNVTMLVVTAEPGHTALPVEPTRHAVLSGPCVKVW